MANSVTIAPRRQPEGLWGITSYFNPAGYRRRLANYRIFREHLTVPLAAVELAYGPDFELTVADAEILVQLRGGDVLWQKERLLNVALGALPKTCRKVVWVDCDIAFDADDWAARVSDLLDRFPFVQTFSQGHYMPRDWKPGELRTTKAEFTRPSIAYAVASGLAADACLEEGKEREYGKYAPGFSWAARRELLEQHGLYDACIIGGGDRAIVSAGYGCFDHVMQRYRMNDREKARYLAWAKPFHNVIGGATGFVDGNLFHLWHGTMPDRRLRERYEEFKRFQFDPFEDIVLDQNGYWRWNSEKPEMHAYMKNYFAARNEDG
jgi:hypothetical protein